MKYHRILISLILWHEVAHCPVECQRFPRRKVNVVLKQLVYAHITHAEKKTMFLLKYSEQFSLLPFYDTMQNTHIGRIIIKQKETKKKWIQCVTNKYQLQNMVSKNPRFLFTKVDVYYPRPHCLRFDDYLLMTVNKIETYVSCYIFSCVFTFLQFSQYPL